MGFVDTNLFQLTVYQCLPSVDTSMYRFFEYNRNVYKI